MQQNQQKSVFWSTTPNRVFKMASPSDYDRSYKYFNHNNTEDDDEEPPSQQQLLDTLHKYPAGAVRDQMAKIMGITNYNRFGGSSKTRKRRNSSKTKRRRRKNSRKK